MEAEYKTVDNNGTKSRYFWRQLFLCIVSVQFYFMFGLTLGSPTVTVPQLRAEANSTEAVSEEMASWLTAITSFTATLWIPIILLAIHFFGRKKPMILIAVNALSGYILFFCSKTVLQVFISQLMQGLTHSSFTTVCIIIPLEYTSPRYRGVFLGLFTATYFWGVWVANTIGVFYNYRYIGTVGIACSIYNLITLTFFPESPYWLACQERYDECAVVHRWLKGVDDDSEIELNALIDSQKHFRHSMIRSKRSIGVNLRKYKDILIDPQIYKPIFINFIIVLSYQFTGKLVCAVYALEIMKKITKSKTEATVGILILDAVSVIGMYVSSFLSKRMKRRTLYIGSSIVCASFQIMLSIYLFLAKFSIILENIYLPLALLVGFSLAACATLTLSSIIFAEFYPTKHRTFAMCIMCIMSKIMLGTFIKLAPLLFKIFKVYGAFLFFAVGFSLSTTLVYKYVPETKNKTIQEISEGFQKKETKLNKQTQLFTNDR